MGKVHRFLMVALAVAAGFGLISFVTGWVFADPPKTSTSVPRPDGTPPQGGTPLQYNGSPPPTPVGPTQNWVGADGKQQASSQSIPGQGGIWTLTWTALYGLAWVATQRKKQVKVPIYKDETYTQDVQVGTRQVRKQVQEGFTRGAVKTLVGYKTEYENRQTGWREWTDKIVTGYKTVKEKVQTGVRKWTELVQQGFRTVIRRVETGVRTVTEKVFVRNEVKTRQVQVGTKTVTRSVPVQKQVTERYIASYRQVWNAQLKKFESVPVYGTKTYWTTVTEQQTFQEPVYKTETYTEPVYETRTREEPVFSDVPIQVPNMVPVEHEEPTFEEVERQVPIEAEVTHREPTYDQVPVQVPVYETRQEIVPLYRWETVEEPIMETRTFTRKVQVGEEIEEQEVVESVPQEVFQGWEASWSFAPAVGVTGNSASDLDDKINAKSEALRKASELQAKLPKEDRAGYQSVVDGLQAELTALYALKGEAQTHQSTTADESTVIRTAPVSIPASSAAPRIEKEEILPQVLDGSPDGIELKFESLNRRVDAASKDLRDARTFLAKLPKEDHASYLQQVIRPLEESLQQLNSERDALIADSAAPVRAAVVGKYAELAKQSTSVNGTVSLGSTLDGLVVRMGAGITDEVQADFVAFQAALEKYWEYVFDPVHVAQRVHDEAMQVMRSTPAKYGAAFPGQDEWALHQSNKVEFSRRFRELVASVWLDKANGREPKDDAQTTLELWRSWVSAEDRAWESRVGSLNQRLIDLKRQRWSLVGSIQAPLSKAKADELRNQLEQMATDGDQLRAEGASLPNEWLAWENEKSAQIANEYRRLWMEQQPYLDAAAEGIRTETAKAYQNALALLRTFVPKPDELDQRLREKYFRDQFGAYCDELLLCDNNASITFQVLQRRFPELLTGVLLNWTQYGELQAVRTAYMSAEATLRSSGSERNREEAQQKLAWWRRTMPDLCEQWDHLGSLPTLAFSPTWRLRMPIDAARVTTSFGAYDSLHATGHDGVDLVPMFGNEVTAAQQGIVVFSGMDPRSAGGAKQGYGNVVIVDHGNGYKTMYAHLSEYSVKTGDVIQAGTSLGTMGSTGFSTGDHLHFMLLEGALGQDRSQPWVGASPLNPWLFLQSEGWGVNFRRIIEDREYRDTGGMSLEEVRRVLRRTPLFEKYASGDELFPVFAQRASGEIFDTGRRIDVASVVYDEAISHNINPRLILARMQTEGALLTLDELSPDHEWVVKGLGYGVPDSGAIDYSKTGLDFQIENAARRLNELFNEAPAELDKGPVLVTDLNWGVLKLPDNTVIARTQTASIQQTGTTTIVSEHLGVENRATWALYQYTPHVIDLNHVLNDSLKGLAERTIKADTPDQYIYSSSNSNIGGGNLLFRQSWELVRAFM